MTDKLTKREIMAIRDAIKNWNGWGLFNAKTTEALGARGYFVRALHPTPGHGHRWHVTQKGVDAWEKAGRP